MVKARVYEGPPLPFVDESNKELCIALLDKDDYMFAFRDDYVAFADIASELFEREIKAIGLQDDWLCDMNKNDEAHYKHCSEECHTPSGQRFHLVRIVAVSIAAIHCSIDGCGQSYRTSQLDRAELAIPLNQEMWCEWICPKH